MEIAAGDGAGRSQEFHRREPAKIIFYFHVVMKEQARRPLICAFFSLFRLADGTERRLRLIDVWLGRRDTGQAKKVEHPLVEVLVATCAMRSGADPGVEIEARTREQSGALPGRMGRVGNSLHGCIAVVIGDDQMRVRTRHATHQLAVVLRQFVLNLLRIAPLRRKKAQRPASCRRYFRSLVRRTPRSDIRFMRSPGTKRQHAWTIFRISV